MENETEQQAQTAAQSLQAHEQTVRADAPQKENTLLGGVPAEPAQPPQEPADGPQAGGGKETNETQKSADYTFTAPEGFSFAEGQQAELTALARELGLGPEKAQKMLDYGAVQIQAAGKRQEEASLAEFDRLVSAWGEETVQRLGDGYEEKLARAKTAVELFATDGFKRLLDTRANGGFGLGNHPDVVETFLQISRAVEEDRFVTGKTGASGRALSTAEVLYPKQVPGKQN